MKTSNVSVATTIVLLALSHVLYAQEASPTQMFVVHEDNIIMSEWDNYWKAPENIKKALVDNNITDVEYYAHSTNDNRFWFVRPIENHAALDNPGFQSLRKKLGDDGMKALFDQFHGTYSSHRNFIVHYQPDLSYRADELGSANQNYRVWMFASVHQGKDDAMKGAMKEWKALNEKTNAKQGYTVYTGGLGMDVPVYMVMFWHESPAAFEALREEIIKMQGKEGTTLWNKTRGLLTKFERVEGWYHPAISHFPEQAAGQ